MLEEHSRQDADGRVYFCTPLDYVQISNGTVSIHKTRTGNRVDVSLTFDAETILQGDCLISQEQFYFIAFLSDAMMILIDFTSLTVLNLPNRDNVTPHVPYYYY